MNEIGRTELPELLSPSKLVSILAAAAKKRPGGKHSLGYVIRRRHFPRHGGLVGRDVLDHCVNCDGAVFTQSKNTLRAGKRFVHRTCRSLERGRA